MTDTHDRAQRLRRRIHRAAPRYAYDAHAMRADLPWLADVPVKTVQRHLRLAPPDAGHPPGRVFQLEQWRIACRRLTARALADRHGLAAAQVHRCLPYSGGEKDCRLALTTEPRALAMAERATRPAWANGPIEWPKPTRNAIRSARDTGRTSTTGPTTERTTRRRRGRSAGEGAPQRPGGRRRTRTEHMALDPPDDTNDDGLRELDETLAAGLADDDAWG